MEQPDLDDDGNRSKKIKPWDFSNLPGEIQIQVEQNIDQENGIQREEEASETASICSLPTEMLTAILKCVDTRSLFKCRVVNKEWNGIGNGILTKRTDRDARVRFEFNSGRSGEPSRFFLRRTRDRSLKDFVQFCKVYDQFSGLVCPFTRFSFLGWCATDFFDHQDFLEFVSDFGGIQKSKRIRCLEFRFFYIGFGAETFEKLAGNVRNMLLNKFPQLEEFGLKFQRCSMSNPQIQLFPASSAPAQIQIQLPHLKSLCFNASAVKKFPGSLADLLRAGVNLTRVEEFYNHYAFPGTYQFFHALGKAHFLRVVYIDITDEFLRAIKQKQQQEQPHTRIEHLEIYMSRIGPFSRSRAADRDATSFISNILTASKNTLRELVIEPLGFLSGIQFPVFPNLEFLRLLQKNEAWNPNDPFFPPEITSHDIFPLVSKLDLKIGGCWAGFSLQDSIPRLPTVEKLSVIDIEFAAESGSESTTESVSGAAVLALMCPNLKHLQIHRNSYFGKPPNLNLARVGREIWTHLKKLESLEFDFDLNSDSLENNPHALDSCFTGISLENVQRLWENKNGAKQPGNSACQNQGPDEISVPEPEPEPEREHPSILDMKDLTTLKIHPYRDKEIKSRVNPFREVELVDRTRFFAQKLTWISEEWAFKSLPHLKPTEEDESSIV